jgi:Ca2+/H+ antiporter, TMEM165/GDT1 family
MDSVLSLMAVSFAAVFSSELIGDKLLYSIGILGARYRRAPVLCGVGLAFMAKMAAAVLLGNMVAHMPAHLVAVLSAATFFTMGLVLWFKAPERASIECERSAGWLRVASVSFAMVFFSEWGDMGQVTAAALATRYGIPYAVWVGGTFAMMTKAVLAMTMGAGLRNRVPERILRYCGVCLMLSLGVLALFRF